MDLLEAPLATTEFLVVDTETNGRAGEACELTEIGAVLVGGGELHDRWETLIAGGTPPSRAAPRWRARSGASRRPPRRWSPPPRRRRPRCPTSRDSCQAASSSPTTPR